MAITVLTAVPDSDDSNPGTWTTTTLFGKVDDVPISDADLISSPSAPSNAVCSFTLSNIADLGTPAKAKGHRVKYRARKAAGGSHQMDLTVRLLQGATQIGSWTTTDLTTSFVTYEKVLSSVEAGNISDYTDLKLELKANKQSLTAVPTYVGEGTLVSGTGNLTPGIPAGTVAGDIMLLVVESANQTIALTTANGFAQATTSPQGTGTAAATTAVAIACYWKRAVGGDSSPVVTAPGNHGIARIMTFRGCKASGNPWNATPTGNTAASSTAVTIPGITTTVNNCMIVSMVANLFDTATSQGSGFTNAGLTGLTLRINDNTSQGNGGGFSVATGIKATAGASGNTTATLANASVQARYCIALEPEPLVDTTCDVSGCHLVERDGPDASLFDMVIEVDQITGLVNNDPISVVDDIGPADNDAVQPTSGERPLYITGQTPSGHAAMRFDGVDDFLESELTMPTGNAPVIIVALYRMIAPVSFAPTVVSWGARTASQMVALESNGAADSVDFSGYSNDLGSGSDALDPPTWGVVSLVWDQTSRYIRINKTNVATGVFAGKITASSTLKFGRPVDDGDGPNPANMDFVAAWVGSFVPLLDDIQEIENYLDTKYLTSGGPVSAATVIASTSTVAANATVAYKIASVTAGTSTVAAATSIPYTISSTSAGQSSVSGNAIVSHPVAAVVAGVSTVSADTVVGRNVAATVPGVGTVAAQASVSYTVAATVVGVSTVAANANVDHPIAALIAGVSTVAANAAILTNISATSAGVSTVSASVALTLGVSATIAATCTVSASVLYTQGAAAVVAGQSTVAGNAIASYVVSAAVASTSTVSAAATVNRGLAAVVASTSTVSVDSVVTRNLAAVVASAAGITANVKVDFHAECQVVGFSVVTAILDGTTAKFAEASIVSTSTVQASALLQLGISATIVSTLTVDADAKTSKPVAAAIVGTSAIQANAIASFNASAIAVGQSTVVVNSPVAHPVAATIAAQSVVTANAEYFITQEFLYSQSRTYKGGVSSVGNFPGKPDSNKSFPGSLSSRKVY